jgi:hypothetical protein
MNMFKAVKAKTVGEYLNDVPIDRKPLILFFHDFIQKSAPKLKASLAYNMLGYGTFQYQNSKKQVLNWPIIALANQKNYISIYVCSIEGGQYLAEKYKSKLGKVSVGKSCIRFKKLEDVNLATLKKVIQTAAKKPGLVKENN